MKIAVLVSGGVDSAFSLHSLSKVAEVTAFYIKIWNPQYEQEDDSQCPWKEDIDYVEKLCNQLNVELKIVNLQNEYQFTVMEYMISELKKGRTPNPDVFCNSYIKFGAFLDHISFDEYDFVASGHYATKVNNSDSFMYWHEADKNKDQTFFLSKLKPEQIEKIIFPCSGLNKSDIRKYAVDNDLPQKHRKDSQGLCFIGNINYSEFISRYIPNKEGNIYNCENGMLLGKHNGIHLYTEGQRKGLDLPNGPWYVFSKNSRDNSITVVNRTSFHRTKTNALFYEKLEYSEHFNKKETLYLKLRHPQPYLIEATFEATNNVEYIKTKEHFYPWNFSSGQVFAIYQKDQFGYKLVGNATVTK